MEEEEKGERGEGEVKRQNNGLNNECNKRADGHVKDYVRKKGEE